MNKGAGRRYRHVLLERGGSQDEMLTLEQAGDLAQVQVQRIYEWLTQGKAHGMKMLNGQDRVCKNSLFEIREE